MVSDLMKILLEKRGITQQEEIEKFLSPDYERDLHDPFLMRDMERSCVRLFEAFENNQKIVIYSDYDCDGIPGAVVLSDLFKKLNYINYEVYIPQRNSEGYGLNMSAIEKFRDDGVNLLITIDLGITALEEIIQAEVYGIDVIVTDHHLPKVDSTGEMILPRAFAILNPKTDSYPEPMLCGAGVVFKFVQGFLKKYGDHFRTNGFYNFLPAELVQDKNLELKQSSAAKLKNPLVLDWEKWLLDMAGMATLSDMVPLLGENRAIAYFGLKVLRKSPRAGLVRLLKKMNIDQRYLTEDDVGFMIAPRINAASRMDDPKRAFELLSSTDETEAGILADHLTKINDERKNIVKSIMRETNSLFEKRELKNVIVVGNPKWKVGVLGLVAGKILDKYNKPVFVWGKDENDCIKGSCRSPGSVSVVSLMAEVRESFVEFGGHELAGGFSVHSEKIHFLEEELSLAFEKISVEKNIQDIVFDIKGDLSLVNIKTWRDMEKLAPFGFANPKPVFLFENVKIEKLKKFGKGGSEEHLEIIFTDHTKNKITAIAFFSDENSFSKKTEEDINVSLYASFDLSRFRGREELRLRIIDII
jgi:single-stranded-DNA-specific exonuclease